MSENTGNGAAAGGAEAQSINLKVRSTDDNEVHFRIKKHTRLDKLMNAYCTRVNQLYDSVRFMFDGVRLDPNSTPQDVGLEDGDVIDALVSQIGGAAL